MTDSSYSWGHLVMWDLCYVTSETGFCFKRRVYFCQTWSTHLCCSRQDARYIKALLRVLMSVCLSVNDTPLCDSYLLLFWLFAHTCMCCPPTTSQHSSSFTDTSRGLHEHYLTMNHEWMYLYGHRTSSEIRKFTLYKSRCLFMEEYEQRLVLF